MGRNLGYGTTNGSMIRNQLKSIIRAATELHNAVLDSDELPDWVLTKVNTSMDRLITANQYIISKLDGMKTNPKVDVDVDAAVKQAKDLTTIVKIMG